MDPLENILVVIERGAEQYPEIERAAELAEASGARIHLLVREYSAVLYWHYFFGSRGDKMSQAAYEREAQAWVDDQARALREQGIAAEGEALWARNVYKAIQERVRELKPDLLIKGAHDDHFSGKRSLYNTTDWQLMRHSPVPVLLVKYQSRAQSGAILCAVQPAHPEAGHHRVDDEIMAMGQTLSECLGRPLRLFNSFQSPSEHVSPPITLDRVAYDRYLKEFRQEHDRALDEFIGRHRVPDTNVHRTEGDPAERLAELAEKLPATLVVMGVVSRSALPELVIGHTAERLLDRLKCDILAVHPPTD